MKLDSHSRGEAIKVGVLLASLAAFLTAYTLYLSDNWTGADAAALARGGCPEGYIATTTTQIGVVGTKTAVLYGTQCVVKP